ncbi:hypothetical protein F8M41_022655 [Gigaspora margarita]|uniref:Uncharacterized protein n=1 Tax=Gigaspora margarita TaxID=4874 RepID=A0A8H4AEQ3_GIGMA|nr:hypothetical protein F8M41_022655 [Gigaspora margarita]
MHDNKGETTNRPPHQQQPPPHQQQPPSHQKQPPPPHQQQPPPSPHQQQPPPSPHQQQPPPSPHQQQPPPSPHQQQPPPSPHQQQPPPSPHQKPPNRPPPSHQQPSSNQQPPSYQQPPPQLFYRPPPPQQLVHRKPPPQQPQPPSQQLPHRQPPLQIRVRNDTNPMQQQLLRPLQPQQRSPTNSNIYNTNESGQSIFQNNKSNLHQENKSEMKFSTVPLDGLHSVDIKYENNTKNSLPNQGWTSSSNASENPNLRQRAPQSPTETNNSKNSDVKKEQSSEGQTKQAQSQNLLSTSLHWTWILLILFALAALAFTVYRLDSIYVEDKKMQRPFLEVFTNSTDTLMQDLIKISDLPASDTVLKGTVLYKRLANILETSPGFKNNGPTIASYLRHYSTQIMEAGQAFEDMYRQGDLVFWILDREINQILEKLKPNIFGQIFFKDDDPAFFKERIKDMMQVVDLFKSKVTAAIRAVRVADSIRDQTEKGLFRGIKIEAEKFVKLGTRQNDYRIGNSPYISDELIIDVENTKKDLEQAEEILDMLYRSGYGLNRDVIDDGIDNGFGVNFDSKNEIDDYVKTDHDDYY